MARLQPTKYPMIYRNTGAAGSVSYSVRFRDGTRQRARTFPTLALARGFQSQVRTRQAQGRLIEALPSSMTLAEFIDSWLPTHPVRPRTRESYESLLRLHILPVLGDVPLRDLSPSAVRQWHGTKVNDGTTGAATVAHAYRCLRAALSVAVRDRLIPENPCNIRGAGQDRTPERPVPTIESVYAIADAIPARFRAMVLLGATSGLRYGELAALARRHIDPVASTIRVERTLNEVKDLSFGPPKSDAGRRVVSIPASVMADVTHHLDEFVERSPDAIVFLGERGGLLRRRNFNRTWRSAFEVAGIEYYRFHDTRHLAGCLAAALGAPPKVTQRRLGHSSVRASLHYQHAIEGADSELASALDAIIGQTIASRAAGNLDQGTSPSLPTRARQ